MHTIRLTSTQMPRGHAAEISRYNHFTCAESINMIKYCVFKHSTMLLLKSRRFKNFDVQYFPCEEVIVLRNVTGKLYTQFNSIGLLDDSHPDMMQFEEMWKTIRYKNHIVSKICAPVKYIRLDENVKLFDKDRALIDDKNVLSTAVVSMLVSVRGVLKNNDDGSYKLILRVKQIMIEREIDSPNSVCQL